MFQGRSFLVENGILVDFGERWVKKLKNFIFWSILQKYIFILDGQLIHCLAGVYSECRSYSSITFFLGYFPRCKIKYDSQSGGEVQDAIVCCVDRTRRLLVWDFSAMLAVTEKLIDKETVKHHQIKITPSIYYLGNIAVLS